MNIKYFASLLVMLSLVSCGQRKNGAHEGHDHNHAAEAAPAGEHGDEIIFSAAQARAAGLQIYEVVPGEFAQVIKTSGEILPAQGAEFTLTAASDGVLNYGGTLTIGRKVGKGQTLARLATGTLTGGDPVVKARVAYENAEKAYRRAEALVAEKIISEREFEAARLEYETTKSAFEACKGDSSGSGIKVTAPIEGYVKQVYVANGEYVTAGTALATIAQSRRMQLRADVQPRYYSKLPGLRSANFRCEGDTTVRTLSNLDGRLLSYGRSVEADSYYIPAYFEFEGSGDFVSGTFAEVYLLFGQRQGVIAVPESALTEEQGIYYVYVQIDEEGYRKQEVRPGSSDGVRREILSGLRSGDRVVSRGAVQVRLASMSGAIPEGHNHAH